MPSPAEISGAAVLAALPGQHEQVLAVAAHPGGQMVDTEQQL